MTYGAEPAGELEVSEALDGWVVAFDREMEQSGDFATSVAAMTAHGCFDVRGVVERWIVANPSDSATVTPLHAVPDEPEAPEAPPLDVPELEDAETPPDQQPMLPRPEAGSSPDVAYFHNLLQGGIERGEIYAAFPGFRFVIDEAICQHEAAAPILSDIPAGPTRQDLNDEIRGIRQELQARRPERRRWRRD
jgi:hypothetical protein